MDVTVKFDDARLRAIRRMLSSVPGAMPRVMTRGINRTANSARAETTRQLGAKVNVRRSSIRKKIDLVKATYSRWLARLGISRKRISLISFKGTRPVKKGVAYRIETGGARQVVPSAFEQTTAAGVRGVFKRKTESRYPLVFLRGPSLGQIFEKGSMILERVKIFSAEKLEKNIDDQVKLLLSKRT